MKYYSAIIRKLLLVNKVGGSHKCAEWKKPDSEEFS